MGRKTPAEHAADVAEHFVKAEPWRQSKSANPLHPLDESIMWAFLYHAHTDLANAATHCGEVRFSPITFRLAEQLKDIAVLMKPPVLLQVEAHAGRYEEDKGR